MSATASVASQPGPSKDMAVARRLGRRRKRVNFISKILCIIATLIGLLLLASILITLLYLRIGGLSLSVFTSMTPATFRSAFGDVGVRIRRLHACSCRARLQEPKSFAALLATGGIAPELAYITAKFAALAPFARIAALLSGLLPIGGAVNAGTVQNRTVHVGATVAKLTPAGTQMLEPDAVTPAVMVGLDGGYVRSRHRRPERNFEVIAGKVIDADGTQHRFAFARNGESVEQFARALVRPGVRGHTPTTVLSDDDAGLRNLQRCVLPEATAVLDWFHIAMRFEHVLQAATGLGAGTVDAPLGEPCRRQIEHAKWRLWHGRWRGCLVKLASVYR